MTPPAHSWSRPPGVQMTGRRDAVAVVRGRSGGTLPTPPYRPGVWPRVARRAFVGAIGLPETAFTAALSAPQLAGQSRAGLDKARRTVTHDARVSR
jgi:hypothetical protein